jgi:hypothetical protein
LKRAIKGTYVSVEPFHLFRYLDDQSFRYNERKTTDAERFALIRAAEHLLALRTHRFVGLQHPASNLLQMVGETLLERVRRNSHRAALVLGNDPKSGEDGLLQVREIRDLNLAADLVTLSACDTGVGALEGEEGTESGRWHPGTAKGNAETWSGPRRPTVMAPVYRAAPVRYSAGCGG